MNISSNYCKWVRSKDVTWYIQIDPLAMIIVYDNGDENEFYIGPVPYQDIYAFKMENNIVKILIKDLQENGHIKICEPSSQKEFLTAIGTI